MKSFWWQITCIVHCGYRVECEVENDYETDTQRYTGRYRYVPA